MTFFNQKHFLSNFNVRRYNDIVHGFLLDGKYQKNSLYRGMEENKKQPYLIGGWTGKRNTRTRLYDTIIYYTKTMSDIECLIQWFVTRESQNSTIGKKKQDIFNFF